MLSQSAPPIQCRKSLPLVTVLIVASERLFLEMPYLLKYKSSDRQLVSYDDR
jgi:hypothetical protein